MHLFISSLINHVYAVIALPLLLNEIVQYLCIQISEAEKETKLDKIKMGLGSLPREFGKFGREMKEHFTPQYWMMEHGDYKYLWKLNSQSAIEDWVRRQSSLKHGFVLVCIIVRLFTMSLCVLGGFNRQRYGCRLQFSWFIPQ